jgi:transposase
MGGDRRSERLEAHAATIRALLAETTDITIEELRAALAAREIATSYGALWRFFARHKITRKKRPRAPASKTARMS